MRWPAPRGWLAAAFLHQFPVNVVKTRNRVVALYGVSCYVLRNLKEVAK